MAAALLPADWPAPRGVHGFTTLRRGAGVSAPTVMARDSSRI